MTAREDNDDYKVAAVGSICPDAFGLKAGFMGEKDQSVRFRPIVGWASVPNYVEAGKRPFVAVILDDDNHPVMAAPPTFPDFIGVYPMGFSEKEALEKHTASERRIPPPVVMLRGNRAIE